MILHTLLYLIVFSLVMAYNILDNTYIPYVVDLIFIIVSIISIVVLSVARRKIRADFEQELITIERGLTKRICIKVTNYSAFPISFLKMNAVCTLADGKKKKIRLNSFIKPHSSQDVCFDVMFNHCETIRINIKRIYIKDYFWLMEFGKKVDISTDVIVMPKIPMQDVLAKISMDMSCENDCLYSDEKAGDDPTEIFAIREYAPGDKIRNIHWKLSTKIDKIMVKDYGLPLYEKDVVVIDIFPFKEDKAKPVLNEIYDLLYGLVNVMTSRGFGLTVYYDSFSFKTLRIENEADIHNLFQELYATKRTGDVSCAELYYAQHSQKKNRVFYVTDRLDDASRERMKLLRETGPVYYLIPKATGGGEYLIEYVD